MTVAGAIDSFEHHAISSVMKQPTFEFVRQTPMRVTFKVKTTKPATEKPKVLKTIELCLGK